jgi:PAS domain S-box-containing protein
MQPAEESALLRELVDKSGTIIAAVDLRGRLVACNETACRNAGRTHAELVGMSLADLRVSFPVHTPEQWQELIRRIRAEREIAVETALGRLDGSSYRARLTLSLQEHAGERYVLAVGHSIPDSMPLQGELEREARWRKALLELARHPTAASGDVTGASRFIAEMGRGVLPASTCAVFETDDAKFGLDRYPWLIQELQSLAACDLFETGQTEEQRQDARDLVANQTLDTILAAPIRAAGEIWGLLIFGSTRPRQWDKDEIEFAAEAAQQMAHCVLNHQRNQMEQQVRLSEARYRTLLEMSEESIWRVDFDEPISLSLPPETQVDSLLQYGYLADCNDFTARFFGLETADQLRGIRLDKLMAPLDDARRAEFREMVANRFHVTNIPVSHHVQGQERWLLRSSHGIVEDGSLIRLWGATRDITELRRVETELHRSEQRYQTFFSNTPEGIFRIDYPDPISLDLPPEEIVRRSLNEGRVEECNQALAKMWGYQEPKDMVGQPSMDFRLLTRDRWQNGLDFVLGGFRLSGTERAVRTATGDLKWFRYSELGIVDDGQLCGIWGTVSDVTERRAMESELRSLAARNTTLLELERARVAREIHDELGQQLTVLKFEASAWESGKRKPVPGGLTREIDTAIQTVRRIATELRPVILDQYGLAAAVEWQAKEFSRRTGIACECTLEACNEIPERLATPVFRILQEGLTNVARHSGATKVEIHLARSGNRLDLEVRDDGKGLPEGDRPASLGLAGMRERALDAGGQVLVSSVPGQGTLLSASFPIEENK